MKGYDFYIYWCRSLLLVPYEFIARLKKWFGFGLLKLLENEDASLLQQSLQFMK